MKISISYGFILVAISLLPFAMVVAKGNEDPHGGLLRNLASGPSVVGFDLYDAIADTKIQAINNSDVISLCNKQVTIEAISPGSTQVKMYLKNANGTQIYKNLEIVEPWTLGSNNGTDYYPVTQLGNSGVYTIQAKAYGANGKAGPILSTTFELKYCPTISSFRLFDAGADILIKEPIVEGDQIPVCTDQLTIEAVAKGADKVRMKLYNDDGSLMVNNLEIVDPWTLGENDKSDYFPVPQLTVGTFKICAKPMSNSGPNGLEVCIDFEILPCAKPYVSGFKFYNAGTDTLIQDIHDGDVIPLCADEVTIETSAINSDNVLMQLYDGDGNLLVKNREIVEPWTLGQNDETDYYPVHALGVVGHFKICAQPQSDTLGKGQQKCTTFELTACDE